MFPASVPRIFKFTWRTSVAESFSSEVTEKVFAFYNSVENSITFIDIIRKVALPEILRNFFFTGVAGAQSGGCNIGINS